MIIATAHPDAGGRSFAIDYYAKDEAKKAHARGKIQAPRSSSATRTTRTARCRSCRRASRRPARRVAHWGGKVGAAVGTAIAPGPGTLIGGAVGAVAGSFAGGKIGEAAVERWDSQIISFTSDAQDKVADFVGLD